MPAALAGAVVGAAAVLALSRGKAPQSLARRVGSWTELIGNTPMVEIECLSRATGRTILVGDVRKLGNKLPPIFLQALGNAGENGVC